MTAPQLDQPEAGTPGGAHLFPERPFGGWAYIRGKCRCNGCTTAMSEAGRKGSRQRSANSRNKQARARTRVEDVTTTAGKVAGAVSDITGAAKASAGSTPKGGASQAQLNRVVTMLLVYGSVLYVTVGLHGVPVPDEAKDALALSDEEAGSIAQPFVRLLHRSELNSRYGMAVVENSDALTALVTAAMYMTRTSRAVAEIRAQYGPREDAPNVRHISTAPRAAGPGPGAGPGPAPAAPADSPPLATFGPPAGEYVPGAQQYLD